MASQGQGAPRRLELLQIDPAALQKIEWVDGGVQGERSSQPAPKQRLGCPGPDSSYGMEIEKELDVSFAAPTTLVAATLGHQPGIPIIHRNQSHSWRLR